MYQHPALLDEAATYYRAEAMRGAENRRLVKLAVGPDRHTSAQHRLVVTAVTVLMFLAGIALI